MELGKRTGLNAYNHMDIIFGMCRKMDNITNKPIYDKYIGKIRTLRLLEFKIHERWI